MTKVVLQPPFLLKYICEKINKIFWKWQILANSSLASDSMSVFVKGATTTTIPLLDKCLTRVTSHPCDSLYVNY